MHPLRWRSSCACSRVKRRGIHRLSVDQPQSPQSRHRPGRLPSGAGPVADRDGPPLSQMERPVDEGVEDGRRAAEEEDDFVQPLADLIVCVEEHRDDHADVVGGPAKDEGAHDDDGDPQGLDFGLAENLAAGVHEGIAVVAAEDAIPAWNARELNCKINVKGNHITIYFWRDIYSAFFKNCSSVI